jgi:L-threonylcarbamoyladenylate synthase
MDSGRVRILPAHESKSLDEALQVLQHGGVVAHATETCYGFACDLTNPEAVRKLFALKKRPDDQPVSALFMSIEEAKKFVEWNEVADDLARKHLPGALTLVLPMKAGEVQLFPVPGNRLQQGASLGIRISSHPVARKLAELAQVPLSTTSANIHGKPETYSAQEIMDQFVGARHAQFTLSPVEGPLQPDLILDSGTLPPTLPSTIVDLTENTAKILRQGGTVI